jgi:hypothetical protein
MLWMSSTAAAVLKVGGLQQCYGKEMDDYGSDKGVPCSFRMRENDRSYKSALLPINDGQLDGVRSFQDLMRRVIASELPLDSTLVSKYDDAQLP